MRSTETFILRLFVDTGDPNHLRGSIRSVADGEDQPFSGEKTLLSLLRAISGGSTPSAIPAMAEISPDGEIDGLQEM